MHRINFLDKLLFTKHLSVMLKSGITLTEGISIICDQSTNTAFKKVLNMISEDVKNGQTLFSALKKYPNIFDPLYINLVKIGEESGNLDSNLSYLALSLKKNYDFKKKVQGALLYPEIVLLMAFVVGIGISIFVLPQLTDLFKSLDVKLPLSTQILLFVAESMKAYGFFIVSGIICSILLFRLVIEQPLVKPHWQKFLLSIPILGKFLQNVELSSFSRNLGMMLKSGLPITSALQTQIDSTTNLIYKDYVKRIYKRVADGKNIKDAIDLERLYFFPILATKMIGVGEKTGKLDESLLYLGDFFEDEVDSASKDFSTVLEPIILIGVGLVVAYLALAIISPIYQFTGNIRR